MRIILDTNVIISALIFGGKPRSILERVICGEVDLIFSEPIMEELTGVLQRPTFGLPLGVLQTIIAELTSVGILVRPKISIKKIRQDPADNRILECAAEGHVEYVVSGDSHLLELKQYKAIPIITPSQFLVLLEKRS